jgi:hypothetical protein
VCSKPAESGKAASCLKAAGDLSITREEAQREGRLTAEISEPWLLGSVRRERWCAVDKRKESWHFYGLPLVVVRRFTLELADRTATE